MELVAAPRVIIGDEVTSGLDSSTAMKIMAVFRRLAVEYGTCVILTLHQPRSAIFEMADTVTMMDRGHILYQGPRAEASPYFAAQGYTRATGISDPDWLLDVLAGSAKKTKTQQALATLPPAGAPTSVGAGVGLGSEQPAALPVGGAADGAGGASAPLRSPPVVSSSTSCAASQSPRVGVSIAAAPSATSAVSQQAPRSGRSPKWRMPCSRLSTATRIKLHAWRHTMDSYWWHSVFSSLALVSVCLSVAIFFQSESTLRSQPASDAPVDGDAYLHAGGTLPAVLLYVMVFALLVEAMARLALAVALAHVPTCREVFSSTLGFVASAVLIPALILFYVTIPQRYVALVWSCCILMRLLHWPQLLTRLWMRQRGLHAPQCSCRKRRATYATRVRQADANELWTLTRAASGPSAATAGVDEAQRGQAWLKQLRDALPWLAPKPAVVDDTAWGTRTDAPWRTQFVVFAQRALREQVAASSATAVYSMILTVLGILTGVVFNAPPQNQAVFQMKLLLAQLIMCLVAGAQGMSLLAGDRAMYRRDRGAGSSAVAYFLAKNSVQTAMTCLQPLFFLCGFAPLSRSYASVWQLWGMLFVLQWAAAGVGQLAAAIFERDTSIAMVSAIMLCALPNTFMPTKSYFEHELGLGSGGAALAMGWSIIRWGSEGLAVAEFAGFPAKYRPLADATVASLGYDADAFAFPCVFMVCLLGVAFRAVALVVLTQQRKHLQL